MLTLGWLGPGLVLVGLAMFLMGAAQIYWAKFRKSGMVTKGLIGIASTTAGRKISVFVILARLREGATIHQLFRRGDRDLLRA